jgi:predicted outer membrane protein
MSMRRQLYGVGLGVALCCGAVWAQQDTGARQEQRAGQEPGAIIQDKLDLLQQVAFLDQTQIALGRLALEKSSDSGVRAFAQGLVQDHQQHLSQLQDYADANGLDLGLLSVSAEEPLGVGGSGPVGSEQSKPPVKYSDQYIKQVNAFAVTRSELAALRGKAFDQAFLLQVNDFQKQGQKLLNTGHGRFGDDASLALLLDRLGPLLRNHQTQAASLVKAQGAPR